jgi:hypothetical protein
MAYSGELAERIRDVIDVRTGVAERKMFGGIAWMVNGNMACGIIGEDLMVRLDRDDAEAEAHVGPMEFTGRPMAGFILVDAGGIGSDPDLARWVDAGADFAQSLPPRVLSGRVVARLRERRSNGLSGLAISTLGRGDRCLG